ncbi:MAG: hypothetical protein DHS20C07_22250 [Methyloligella sp.]|nr:MAG: hypothetical protein DHS20C07_22250 [Methyloligella sp.]
MSSKEDDMLKALDEMEHAALNQSKGQTVGIETNIPEAPSKQTTGYNEDQNDKSSKADDKTVLEGVRFKQIGGHFHIDVHKAIALIGVNEDRTIQSLAAEAFEDLLLKRGCEKSILELTKLTRPTKK